LCEGMHSRNHAFSGRPDCRHNCHAQVFHECISWPGRCCGDRGRKNRRYFVGFCSTTRKLRILSGLVE
jgi:hypothetical protein